MPDGSRAPRQRGWSTSLTTAAGQPPNFAQDNHRLERQKSDGPPQNAHANVSPAVNTAEVFSTSHLERPFPVMIPSQAYKRNILSTRTV